MEDQEAPFVTETTKAAPTEVATETEKSIGTRDTNVPWYTPAEDAAQLIGSDVRELLVEYSGIPAEEVERHVISLVSNT